MNTGLGQRNYHRIMSRAPGLWFPLVLVAFCYMAGCAVVPAYKREHLARPGMQPTVDPLEHKALAKLHRTREVAGGGEGSSAGGGCACGN